MKLRVLAILLTLAASATADESERLPQFQKLSNGLRICAIPRPDALVIDMQTWFRVGSSYDPPTLPGLTDAVRILLQNEIDPLDPSGNLHRTVDTYVETTRDAVVLTAPQIVISGESKSNGQGTDEAILRLRNAFQKHALAFHQPKYSSAPFDKLRQLQDHGYGAPLVETQLLESLFDGHPYRYAPQFWGDCRSISDKDAIAQHHQRWFAPTNATVFVSGPLMSERVFAIAKEAFGGIEWRDTPQRAAFDPPPDETLFVPAAGPKESNLIYCWLTPGRNWLDNFAIDVLFEHLVRVSVGPLRRKLDLEKLHNVQWAREDWKHAGILSLGVDSLKSLEKSPAAERRQIVQRFAAVVAEELGKAAQTPLDPESLIWARNKVVLDTLIRRASSADRLRRMAEWEMLGGDILLSDWEIPKIEHITAADVMMAATALSESRRVIRSPEMPADAGWRRVATSQPTSQPIEMGFAAWLPVERGWPGLESSSWPDAIPANPPDGLAANLRLQYQKCPDAELVWLETQPNEERRRCGCHTLQKARLESEKWNKLADDRGVLVWRVQCMHRAQYPTSCGLVARRGDFAAAFEILLRQNKERREPDKWELPIIIRGDLDWPETLKTARRIAAEVR